MADDGDFKYNNLTDFEKLLFAEKYIKLLKEKVSFLEIELGKANAYIYEIDSLSHRDKLLIKRGKFYKSLIDKLDKSDKTIRSLRNDNEKLFSRFIIEKQMTLKT